MLLITYIILTSLFLITSYCYVYPLKLFQFFLFFYKKIKSAAVSILNRLTMKSLSFSAATQKAVAECGVKDLSRFRRCR